MSEELKIVIALRGETALLGVQAPDSDPVFSRVEGDLAGVLASVPELVQEARTKWSASPRYPKRASPPSSQSGQVSQPARRQPERQSATSQQQMF